MIPRFTALLAGSAALCLTASTSFAQIGSYSEDFEALNMGNSTELGDNGWLVFGNVFDPGWNYLYGYGPYPAPNGGPGFCGITNGQGGPPQGNQQIVTYSDYNNGDHAVGNYIEANVFQERVVAASDVGKTFVFQFDGKLGDIFAPSTSAAFIKIVDSTVWTLDGYVTVDTTNMPATWSTYSLSITIDANHVGDYFQIGFMNVSTNYDNTGQVYDNITLGEDSVCAVNYCEGSANGNEGDLTIDTCVVNGGPGNTLTLSNSPSALFGYPMIAAAQGSVNPPGSIGELCVGPAGIGRYNKDLQSTGGTGGYTVDIYNSISGGGGGGIPAAAGGGVLMPGDTWNFQCWNRIGGGSTFSAAITVTFQ